MGTMIINLINRLTLKFGYAFVPCKIEYRPWLSEVAITGNLKVDIATHLIQFAMSKHQTEVTFEVTRSMIRMYMAKVIEKYILSGQLPDLPYTITCNADNNPPDKIVANELRVQFKAGDIEGDISLMPPTSHFLKSVSSCERN